ASPETCRARSAATASRSRNWKSSPAVWFRLESIWLMKSFFLKLVMLVRFLISRVSRAIRTGRLSLSRSAMLGLRRRESTIFWEMSWTSETSTRVPMSVWAALGSRRTAVPSGCEAQPASAIIARRPGAARAMGIGSWESRSSSLDDVLAVRPEVDAAQVRQLEGVLDGVGAPAVLSDQLDLEDHVRSGGRCLHAARLHFAPELALPLPVHRRAVDEVELLAGDLIEPCGKLIVEHPGVVAVETGIHDDVVLLEDDQLRRL